MSLLDWLFGRAPKIDDTDVPPKPATAAQRRWHPPGPDDPHETLVVEVPNEDEPLENLFCYLEYEDAKGQTTQRPVTFISLTRRFPQPAIFAVCHMRRAVRNFRTDRIQAIITADGEVFEKSRFLTEYLHLDLSPRTGGIPRPAAPRTQRATSPASRDIRELILAPLTVLVACGKADGHYHRDEIDRIMSWAEMEALHLFRQGRIDSAMTIEEADALGKVIAGMRPQQRTLRQHIATALAIEAEALTRFRRALKAVVAADGVFHAKELEFMDEFDRLADLAVSDPAALRQEIEARQR